METVEFMDRRHTRSAKWDPAVEADGTEEVISMSTADMDFRAARCITDALQKYLDFGVFGYYLTPDSYLEAFCRFEKEVHGNDIDPQWVRFAPGCIPAMSLLLQIIAKPGDSVIVLTPVYPPFLLPPGLSDCRLIKSDLISDRGHYTVDYEDFEKKIIDNHVTCFLLCSPHNPVGRVWTEEELEKMFAICRRHHVFVIADEIHHNLILSGHHHVSALQLKDYWDMTAILMAPTKTFNLASLRNSMVVLPDPKLRELYSQKIDLIHMSGGNAFGYIAAEAAYNGGREWLRQVLAIIEDNYHYIKNRLAAELPLAVVADLQGTYLMWVDLGAYLKPEETVEFLNKECHLYPGVGEQFGGEKYKSFIRLNVATSHELVERAMDTLISHIKNR